MFRCSRALRISLRFIQTRSKCSDPLLEMLKSCRNEYQVFQLVGINKSILNVNHVSYAINLLWQIQKAKTNLCHSFNEIQNHSEFIALRTLAENKVICMDNRSLVNTLSSLVSLKVEAHHSLMQQLVMEGWRRLESLDLSSLSKFSACLGKQKLFHSPLLGEIANIVDKNLDDLQHLRVLTNLMINIEPVCSSDLKHRLITKAESLLGDKRAVAVNDVRRILKFSFHIGYNKPSLVEKCFPVVIKQIKKIDLATLCAISALSHPYISKHPDVQVMIKSRLLEFLELCNNNEDFITLFCTLLPMASQKTRERLENNILLLEDDIHHNHLLKVLKSIVRSQCRNSILIHMIFSMIQKKLDLYKPLHLLVIVEALTTLSYNNYELFAVLRQRLSCKLKECSIIADIVMMTRALSLMHRSNMDEAIISRLDAIVPQCNLKQTNQIARSIMKGLWINPNKSSYTELYKKLKNHALAKISHVENIDVFLAELKDTMDGQSWEDNILKATLDTCQRLLHQVTYRNVEFVSKMITSNLARCTPILDKIAAEVVENIAEFSPLMLYRTVKAFSYLNYEPPSEEEFYNACIQQCVANIGSIQRPHMLVLLAFVFTIVERCPEDFVKAIFNIDFLNRLDLDLQYFVPEQSMTLRIRLMEINRAICLEYPEYMIPWFHDQFSQRLQQSVRDREIPTLRQIRYRLGEALGGTHYTRTSVVTPYYYFVDFECILDKNKNPISYKDLKLLPDDVSKMQSWLGSTMQEDAPLPPGAKRVAVQFLSPVHFCRNSSSTTGLTDMKKRHLEILGYNVIQIPYFEWNSVELGTKEAWVNYLKRKIFDDEC